MESMSLFTFLLIGAFSLSHAYNGHYKNDPLTENLLREVVDKMGRDLADAYFDIPDLESPQSIRSAGVGGDKEFEIAAGAFDYSDTNPHPSLRDQEFIQHGSALWRHQYVQGGAGKGQQLLKPEGSIKSQNQVKTDATLPAYCNPPNPCPVGYTSEDGCLEDFDNTAEYSRNYQAAQECMCDAEHMYECDQEPPRNNELDYSPFMSQRDTNPFLQGEMLPIAAKKGNNVLKFMAMD